MTAAPLHRPGLESVCVLLSAVTEADVTKLSCWIQVPCDNGRWCSRVFVRLPWKMASLTPKSEGSLKNMLSFGGPTFSSLTVSSSHDFSSTLRAWPDEPKKALERPSGRFEAGA